MTSDSQQQRRERHLLCCHRMQHEGGAYGCTLPAGHTGNHMLATTGKRDRSRSESVRLELEGRSSSRKRSTSSTVASQVSEARPPAAAFPKVRRTTVSTADEACSRGYAEKPADEIDRKLYPGAAAEGWRVMEQWPGGGKGGKWFYFAPDGSKYKSTAEAHGHAGVVDHVGGGESRSASDSDDAAAAGSQYGPEDGDGSAIADEAETHNHRVVNVAEDERTAEYEGEQACSSGIDAQSSHGLMQSRARPPACPAEAALLQRLEAAETLAKKWEKLARHYHGLLVNAHAAGRKLFPIALTVVDAAGGTLPVPGPLRPLYIEAIPEVL